MVAGGATLTQRLPLGATECTQLRSLERLGSIGHGPCVVRVRTTVRPSFQRGKRVAKAASPCQSYWRNYSFGWWLSVNVNVGLCNNGSVVWSNWGPDCGVNIAPVYWPIYGSKITWCGVFNQFHHEAQPGINFALTLGKLPWVEVGHGWARFSAWPWGVNYGVGGCC